MATEPNIIVISDEPPGMGSPQILSLSASLAERFGGRATLVCPAATDKLAVEIDHPRIATLNTGITYQERSRYVRYVGALLERAKPEVLVFFSNLALPVLLKLKHQPRLTVNYVLENFFSDSEINFEQLLLRSVAPRIDLFIVPEENRAAALVRAARIDAGRLLVLYNCKQYDHAPLRLPAQERNGRLLHQGSIMLAEEPWLYVYETPARFEMDIYGIFRTRFGDPDMRQRFERMCADNPGLRYLGRVPETELDRIRAHYSYVLCYWHPSTTSQLYACPNKFFEAVASGVPPLASPNPQLRELIKRYDCGILMEDWGYDSFRDAYDYAMRIRGTSRYDALVRNCLAAYERELNWGRQYAKAAGVIDDILRAGEVRLA